MSPARCIFIAVLLSSIAAPLAHADSSTQFWLDYNDRYRIDSTWDVYGDGGFRRDDELDWRTFYARPAVRYWYSSLLEFRGGLGNFYTWNDLIPNTLEIRPFQGVLVKWPTFEPVEFRHYFRLEERITFYTEEWSSDFVVRFRYKLSTSIPIRPKLGFSSWSIPLGSEFFFDLGDEIVEQFSNRWRLEAGVAYRASDTWSGDVLVIWQRSRGVITDDPSSEYIFRFQLKRVVTLSE